MIVTENLNRLSHITDEEWKIAIKKCYGHINIKLGDKTRIGAHCQQRLGMKANDFYLKNALLAIYEGIWSWDPERFTITEQLIRIINSMISEEVRKYKVEVKRGRKTILMEPEQLFLALEENDDEDYDEDNLDKLTAALFQACESNEKYKTFLELKKKELSYKEIADEMKCTISEAYQLMETISRRSRKLSKLM